MYFITDEPILFHSKSNFILSVNRMTTDVEKWWVLHDATNRRVFHGTEQECKDFVHSIAAWVGAMNPVESHGREV